MKKILIVAAVCMLANTFCLCMEEKRESYAVWPFYAVKNFFELKYQIRLNNNLLDAARTGDLDAVKKNIEAGASVHALDGFSQTSLYHAAKNNHIPVVSYLIDQGAHPNEGKTFGDWPLAVAVTSGHFECASVLIKGGSDINRLFPDVMSMGHTLLHAAACTRNASVVEFLINHGADTELVSRNDGSTPLFYAVRRSSLEVAQLLLHKGVNIMVEDKEGNLPIVEAFQKKENSLQFVKLVLKYAIKYPTRLNAQDKRFAWQKLRLLLVASKDANSPLSRLPQDLLLNILFYTPDCITGKPMFNKLIDIHCSGSTDKHKAFKEFAQCMSEGDGPNSVRKLLEHKNKQGKNALESFIQMGIGTFLKDYTEHKFLLNPNNAKKTYKMLLSEIRLDDAMQGMGQQ